MSNFHPDRIIVDEAYFEDVLANGARFNLLIKGTSLFAGNAAFKKARELSVIVDALKPLGITEADFVLKEVRVEVASGVLTKFSSVNYRIQVKCRKVESVAEVLGAIANAKSAILESLQWDYPVDQEARSRWMQMALELAKTRAAVIAESLGVKIIGVYECGTLYSDELSGMQTYGHYEKSNISKLAMIAPSAPAFDPGIQLIGSERRGVSVRVEFRVGPMQD